jgi:hypothetical protein
MNIVNEIITRLRRDDTLLEPLRHQVIKEEKPVDWEQIQKVIVYVLITASVLGFGVMVAMWIAL